MEDEELKTPMEMEARIASIKNAINETSGNEKKAFKERLKKLEKRLDEIK